MARTVKCVKLDARIPAATVRTCSRHLEDELALFPQLQAILLMGDVAIASLNAIARRSGEPRVIPAGSTYRIRGGDYRFRGIPVLPSYLQAGPAYFIEASKRASTITRREETNFACIGPTIFFANFSSRSSAMCTPFSAAMQYDM
jgi:uracil-DNA glycosylase